LEFGKNGVSITLTDDRFMAWQNRIQAIRANDERIIEHYLYGSSITPLDYIKCSSFLTLYPNLGLYTLANVPNNRDDYKQVMMKDGIYSLPVTQYINYQFIYLKNDSKYSDGEHSDYHYDINECVYEMRKLGKKYISLNAREVISGCLTNMSGLLGKLSNKISTLNPNGSWGDEFSYIMLKKDCPFDITLQSYKNSQTNLIKSVTPEWRKILTLSDFSLHKVRQLAMIRRYTNCEVTVDNIVINGVFDDKPYAVSGHMINFIVGLQYKHACIYRYLSTIHANIIMNDTNIWEREEMLHDNGEAAERKMLGLWHTYDEYILSLDVLAIYNEMGLAIIRPIWIHIIRSHLEKWKVKYPSFSKGIGITAEKEFFKHSIEMRKVNEETLTMEIISEFDKLWAIQIKSKNLSDFLINNNIRRDEFYQVPEMHVLNTQ